MEGNCDVVHLRSIKHTCFVTEQKREDHSAIVISGVSLENIMCLFTLRK